MLPLLELERQAEVDAAEEALAAGSPEAAAAKGRALLNLRLADAEGGLLGRTLLTLVNNKARPPDAPVLVARGWVHGGPAGPDGPDGIPGSRAPCAASRRPPPLQPGPPRLPLRCSRSQGGGTQPLPPHKLAPHDIVRLRPSKGDGGGAALAEGVVYRIRDAAITVAGTICVAQGCSGLQRALAGAARGGHRRLERTPAP